MFKDTDNGQTQYCPMCEEWARKYEKLKKENEELKEKVNSYNCSPNCYKYRKSEQYKQALEEVKKIIKSYCIRMCKGCYIECINHEIKQKINEVMKDEN